MRKAMNSIIAQSSIPTPNLSKYLISIVEDDQFVRQGLEDLILSLGHDAAAFASAEEYLRSDRVRDTACLISDLQMPGMTGADLQERRIAGGHYIPIIFVTAVCSEHSPAKGRSAGSLEQALQRE